MSVEFDPLFNIFESGSVIVEGHRIRIGSQKVYSIHIKGFDNEEDFVITSPDVEKLIGKISELKRLLELAIDYLQDYRTRFS